MMQFKTIAQSRVLRVIIIALAFSIVMLSVTIGPYLWNILVVMGMRPWNMRIHTRDEIIRLADRDPLKRETQLIGSDATITELFWKGGSIVRGSEPAYLVFNRDGFLLRQHACFESMPGFLDSTRKVRGWYTLDSTFRLGDYVRRLRCLISAVPYTPDRATKSDYTVLLGWNNYFRHAERKIDSFLLTVHQKPYSTRVLMINTNKTEPLP